MIVDRKQKRLIRRINWKLMPWQRKRRFTILGWQVWL